MRLLRLLIAAAVVAGAGVLLKRLLEEEAAGPRPISPTPPAAPSRGASETSPPRTSGEDRSAAVSGASRSDNGGEPTKAELYERAQELGIEGRSRMSKQELKRAIEAAG